MLLALLDPETPAIMEELDGEELFSRQAIVSEGVERHEDYCCWFYELTAGILESCYVSPGKDNFMCEKAFLESMLNEDAEAVIDLMLEVKMRKARYKCSKDSQILQK